MDNMLILGVQTLTANVVFVLIFHVYLRPWFASQPFGPAVLPLLILHGFRYLGLTLIVPGQIEAIVPRDALRIMAWGDYASGFAALCAAIAVHNRWSFSALLVALFTLVGVGDLVVVGYTATSAGVFQADIGAMWFLLVLYAPTLLLSHIYIAYRLVKHLSSGSGR